MFALSDMMRVVLAQYVVTLITALACAVLFGKAHGVSALLGGLSYAVMTTLLWLALMGVNRLRLGSVTSAMTMLLGEFVKVLCVILLLLLIAQLYADLNWPALIFSLMAAANSCFVVLFKKH